jgi:serine/threonine protein kinase
MAKYKFGRKIGSGGFGVVRHATRTDDGLPFAVKQLLDQHKDDEEVVARFRREVRLQKSLKHPNVLPIVGWNLSASPPWFVMPIAERTLLDEIVDGLKEDDDRVVALFREVLEGISHAHSKGVVHRDLKPENVMMTHDGHAQVSDFGLGKNLFSNSPALTKTHLGAGSFPYVAPEQMVSLKEADGRADVYALGKTLQAMVTSKIPVLTDDKDVPMKYRYFIAKCTVQDAADRYQNIDEVIRAFEQVVKGVQKPRPPREVVLELIEEWRTLPVGEDLDALKELHEHLERNADDALLFQTAVPQIPEGMLHDYIHELPTEFKRMLDLYDGHVEGSLDFDYCDVVANLYHRVYNETDDLAIKRLILNRLMEMGPSHNRYHVGDVFGWIMTNIDETSEVMMAADVIDKNRGDAGWFAQNPRLRAGKLPPALDEALFGGGDVDASAT